MNFESFNGRNKRKTWNAATEEYMSAKRRQNFAGTDRGSYYGKEKWLEEFLDSKGAFYKDNESDDSNNNDENYHENNKQQQLQEGFANSRYKIVSPILFQKLINDFAVYKHFSGTLLLVEDKSHGFGNKNYTLCEKCPYSGLFWSAFSRIQTEYGKIRCISPYSV